MPSFNFKPSKEVKSVISSLSGCLAKLEREVDRFSMLSRFVDERRVMRVDSYRKQLCILRAHVKHLEMYLECGNLLFLEEDFEDFLHDLKFLRGD